MESLRVYLLRVWQPKEAGITEMRFFFFFTQNKTKFPKTKQAATTKPAVGLTYPDYHNTTFKTSYSAFLCQFKKQRLA